MNGFKHIMSKPPCDEHRYDSRMEAAAISSQQDSKYFRRDVVDYTLELRTNRFLRNLREALAEKRFPVDEVLCAGYLENDEGIAVGAIVCPKGFVREFEFDHNTNKLNRFKKVTPRSIETYITAIPVAIEFRDELFRQIQASGKRS